MRNFQGWNVIEKETSIAYMIIYLSVTFNIFIFCYIGEVLTEQVKTFVVKLKLLIVMNVEKSQLCYAYKKRCIKKNNSIVQTSRRNRLYD